MSNVEVSENGVKIPTWTVGVILALAVAWMGWMSSAVISTKTEIVELRAQVKSTSIPEGTEKALSEIRARMNAELVDRNSVQKLATENAKDISYIIRELETFKARKP